MDWIWSVGGDRIKQQSGFFVCLFVFLILIVKSAVGIQVFNFFPDFMFLVFFLNFLFIIYLLFLFLAVLGLRFCARALSSCGKWGPLFIAVRGPLTVTASLVAEQRLQTLRLSSRGPRAQSLHGMWDPPRSGLEPVSPALAGGFSTTAPPGKPSNQVFIAAIR